MMTTRVVIAGVGGQGTLLATRLIAETAIKNGLHVRIGETYGMAQSGGPVMGHIQSVKRTHPDQTGEADALLGFELAEATRRGVTYLKEGGLAIVNSKKIPPVEVISGMRKYPEEGELVKLLKKVTNNIRPRRDKPRRESGDPIATNIVMLGALAVSDVLPFSEKEIIATMKESIPERFLELNTRAFMLGAGALRK